MTKTSVTAKTSQVWDCGIKNEIWKCVKKCLYYRTAKIVLIFLKLLCFYFDLGCVWGAKRPKTPPSSQHKGSGKSRKLFLRSGIKHFFTHFQISFLIPQSQTWEVFAVTLVLVNFYRNLVARSNKKWCSSMKNQEKPAF